MAELETTQTTTTAQTQPTLNEKYQSMVGNNVDTINTMYDANKESSLSSLENAYNNNLSNYEAQKQTIDTRYNTAANDLEAQYQRNRMANNIQAAGNGLNTGTGSQMALAQSSAYQRDYGTLRNEQAQQQIEQDRLINNLKSSYENQVREAIANNDQARAAALLDEYNRQTSQVTNLYSMQMEEDSNRAALLAAGGDYSGYAQLLGLSTDQQGVLEAQWISQNPLVAYQSGLIDATQYKSLTGKYPIGYVPTGSGVVSNSGYSTADDYYQQKVIGKTYTDAYNANIAKGNDAATAAANAMNTYESKWGTMTDVTKGKIQ